MSQVRAPGTRRGFPGLRRGRGRGTPQLGLGPARGEGAAGPRAGPSGVGEREAAAAGPRLPVQGLHAGLPGAGGGGPRDPRGPPAARRPRAQAPAALAGRRRRRWPVHGAPSPPPPQGSRRREGSGAPEGPAARLWRPRSAARPAQAAAAISCHLAPRVTHKASRVGWGAGRAARGREPGPPAPAPPEHHLGARPASRRGRAQATGHVPSHLGSKSTNGLCRKNVLCSGNYQTDIRDAGLKKKKSLGKFNYSA